MRKEVLLGESCSFPFKAYLFEIFRLNSGFLEFRRYHNFASLFSTLSESIFFKKVSFSIKYRAKSIRLAVLRGISCRHAAMHFGGNIYPFNMPGHDKRKNMF